MAINRKTMNPVNRMSRNHVPTQYNRKCNMFDKEHLHSKNVTEHVKLHGDCTTLTTFMLCTFK